MNDVIYKIGRAIVVFLAAFALILGAVVPPWIMGTIDGGMGEADGVWAAAMVIYVFAYIITVAVVAIMEMSE